MAYDVPEITTAPNVGPEPAGLMQSVRERVFGAAPGKQPGPYDLTDEQYLEVLQKVRAACEPGREVFVRNWERNLLYFNDRQWIWSNPGANNQWQDKRLAKWMPKPVTNFIQTDAESIRADLASIQFGITARPIGQSPKNITAADTASQLASVLYKEHNMSDVMTDADLWAILLGNAYLHPHWDKDDRTHQQDVEMWQCQVCQAKNDSAAIVDAGNSCPDCHSKALVSTGNEMRPIGRGRTLAVSPLELLMPTYVSSFGHVNQLDYLTWRPREDIEDEYGSDIAKKVSWDRGPSQRSLQLYKQLGTMSNYDSNRGAGAWSSGAGSLGDTEGTTEQHVWIKPCKKFPEGLYMRYLGESSPVVARISDEASIPFRRKKDNSPLWPWLNYAYAPSPGRLYARSMVDAVIQKQDQLNQGDSMVQLSMQRMANPVWLEPKGAEVERLTGEPGLTVRYQQVGSQGAKPERVAGLNPPTAFFELRKQYRDDMQDLTGSRDVLAGGAPPGVESFSGLQLLVDRSKSRFSTLYKMRANAQAAWYMQALEIERTHGPAERVIETLGPNNAWTFQTFMQMDLDGDINILVEDGAMAPKTALGRRAAIEHGNQLGLFNPQDTEQRYQLAREVGVTSLFPSLDSDISACLREQDAFEEWVRAGMQGGPDQSPLIRMPWHDDKVHLGENRKWMNGDGITALLRELQPEQQGLLVKMLADHLAQHQAVLNATMQQQAAMEGGAPAPGPGGGPSASGPTPAGAPPSGGSGGGAPRPGSPRSGSDGKGVGAARAMHNSSQNSKPPSARGAV